MRPESLRALADILQVLGNPARLALLHALQTPRSVADLTVAPSRSYEGLDPERGIARQSLERHLEILERAGLVSWQEGPGKNHQVKVYALNHARLFAAVEELRVLTRLRATVAPEDDTMAVEQPPLADPDAVPGPRLVLLRGVPEGRLLPLAPGENVVGRGEEAQLRLDYDPFVSARHCVLRRDRAAVTVADTGVSRNGTSLHGRRLRDGEAATLRRGHLLQVGRSLLLYLD